MKNRCTCPLAAVRFWLSVTRGHFTQSTRGHLLTLKRLFAVIGSLQIFSLSVRVGILLSMLAIYIQRYLSTQCRWRRYPKFLSTEGSVPMVKWFGLLACVLLFVFLTAAAPTVLAPGAVVGLSGTPHLWIADDQGVLHWVGDTRALADKTINWNDRQELSLSELSAHSIGDPWLSAGLLKEGDSIYLVKWESDWEQPKLLHIQSFEDVEIFGIDESNYGDIVLDTATWEASYGLSVATLEREELAAVVSVASTPTVIPPAAPTPTASQSQTQTREPTPSPTPSPTQTPEPTPTRPPGITPTVDKPAHIPDHAECYDVSEGGVLLGTFCTWNEL